MKIHLLSRHSPVESSGCKFHAGLCEIVRQTWDRIACSGMSAADSNVALLPPNLQETPQREVRFFVIGLGTMNEYPDALRLQNSRGLVQEAWTVRAKHRRGLPGYNASKISCIPFPCSSASLSRVLESWKSMWMNQVFSSGFFLGEVFC